LNTRSKNLRSGVRRLEILEGAAEAIRRLGLQGAGMRQIAQACGITPGNLYYYFRDKHELVYFCQDTTLNALIGIVREAQALRPAEAQLRWLIGEHLRVTLDERAAGAAHLELDGMPKPLYRKLVAKRDRYERAVRAVITDGQARGELRAGDPKLAAFALLGALNWAARWYRPGGDYSVHSVAVAFAEQLVQGLVADGASKRGRR